MGMHLRYTTAATAGAALLGLTVYAVFKSGALRPVLVGAIRGGMKTAEWAGDKMACARKNVEAMVIEAKIKQTKPAAAPAAKPAAKNVAKPTAKKSTPKVAAKPASTPAA